MQAADEVYYQAHRGSVDEAPENTLAAYRHAWRFPGAIPEIDVRTTADGALVCLHDATLARTTNAPPEVRDRPVAELTFAEVRRWDAGIRFGPQFAGERVPSLDELLAEVAGAAERRLYVEPKSVDLLDLRRKLDDYAVTERVIFVSGQRETLVAIQELFPGAPAMTWAGGTPDAIRQKVAHWRETGLAGLRQLQLHLPVEIGAPGIHYALDDAFLVETMAWLRAKNVDLQLRPFALDAPTMQRLLRLGVRWFVTDAPEAFWRILHTLRKP
jgi:glycerophosphoryl diester phosphodiesterase